MLANQNRAILVVDHAVRTHEGSFGSIFAVVPSRPQNFRDLPVLRPLPDHISLDIAEPDVSGVKPKRPFHELEAISQFFELRGGRHKGIEGRIEPDQVAMNW